MQYSPELKEAILRRILPLNNESITKVAKEEGLPEQTIRTWRNRARAEGAAAPARDNSEEWSTQDKFLIVVESKRFFITPFITNQTTEKIGVRPHMH